VSLLSQLFTKLRGFQEKKGLSNLAIVTAVELNDQHGTGIFVRNLLDDPTEVNVFCSKLIYGGADRHFKIPEDASLDSAARRLIRNQPVDKILCVPYFPSEFRFAVKLKEKTEAPLCTFLMDDQNIFTQEIHDRDVQALLNQSDLILAISPEMAEVYSRKYNREVLFFPPFVTPRSPFVKSRWNFSKSEEIGRGAMIGNIWSQKRFAQILDLLDETGISIDWYGHGGKAPWLEGTPEEWVKKGLCYHGWLEKEKLIQKLAEYPFVLMPSGEMDASDDKLSFSKLSLPSRLVFLNARVGVPVLVLGHPETAAARFVRRFGTGVSASGQPVAFRQTIEKLLQPEFRSPLLANLARHADLWSHDNPGEMIWEALAGNRQKILQAEHQKFFKKDRSFRSEICVSAEIAP